MVERWRVIPVWSRFRRTMRRRRVLWMWTETAIRLWSLKKRGVHSRWLRSSRSGGRRHCRVGSWKGFGNQSSLCRRSHHRNNLLGLRIRLHPLPRYPIHNRQFRLILSSLPFSNLLPHPTSSIPSLTRHHRRHPRLPIFLLHTITNGSMTVKMP